MTFTLTSTTVAQYRFDNFNTFEHDDGYLSIFEKLEVAAQSDPLRLTARVDGFLALFNDECPEAFDPSECIQNDLRLERFTAHYERDGLTLDAVDSYAVLGRGIALSLRRVDLLGVDNSLRGGHIAYNNRGFYARALGGAVNPQNLDPQLLTIRDTPRDQLRGDLFTNPETRDWVAGAEVGVRLGRSNNIDIGLHGQRVWFARNEVFERRTAISVGGWHLGASGLADGRVSLYGEMNVLGRTNTRDSGEVSGSTGHAFYGMAQLSLDRINLLLEWKDYSNYLVAEENLTGEAHRIYSAAPTLERGEERLRGLHNARGGRLQLDYAFRPGPWSISATALGYAHAENIEVDPFDGILVTHGFAKIQKINDAVGEDEIGWTLDILAGARRESYLDSPFADIEQWDLDWRVLHFQVEAGIVIGSHSLELNVIHRSERRRLFDLVDFQRGGASLTWSYRGKIRISPALNWNNERASAPSLYPGIEARVDFLEGSFLRVFGGRTPGGLLCSGGVCREVPPFEGVLAELVLRL